MPSLNARLIERPLHHKRIIAERIKLATAEINRRKIPMDIRREDREKARIIRIGPEIPRIVTRVRSAATPKDHKHLDGSPHPCRRLTHKRSPCFSYR
jgi:hypothetical protein